jgi:hypothetical protein
MHIGDMGGHQLPTVFLRSHSQNILPLKHFWPLEPEY